MDSNNSSKNQITQFFETFIKFHCEELISIESVANQLSLDSHVVSETHPDLYLIAMSSGPKNIDPKVAHNILKDCEEALYFQQATLEDLDDSSNPRKLLLNRFASSMLAFALASEITEDLSFCLSPILEIAYRTNKNSIIDSGSWNELFTLAYSKSK